MRRIGIIGGGASGIVAAIASCPVPMRRQKLRFWNIKSPLAKKYWQPVMEDAI